MSRCSAPLIFTCVCWLLSILGLWYALTGSQEGQHCLAIRVRDDWHKHTAALIVVAYAAPTTWLVRVGLTKHVRQTAVYLLWNWASAACMLLRYALPCSQHLGAWVLLALAALGSLFTTFGAWASGVELATSRLEALEAQALKRMSSRRLRPTLTCWKVLIVPILLAFFLQGIHWIFTWAVWAVCAIWLLTFVAWTGMMAMATRRAMRLMREAATSAPDWMAVWAKRAHGAMHFELWCLVVMMTSTVVKTVVSGVHEPEIEALPERFYAAQLLYVADLLCNLLCALLLSGAHESAQVARQRGLLSRQREVRRREAMLQWAKRQQAAVEGGGDLAAWDGKVKELAARSISLRALLDFYQGLPDRMPHFDGARHTTGDVVRQAVIPLTWDRECAAADVLMEGSEPAWPQTMVTHAWNNVFRDLVAAVVADAFGEGEYAFYAKLLAEDMPRLQHWVELANVGGRRYWICAFAVNQHTSICHTNHARQDSVTGRPCQRCPCEQPKCWADTPPILPDGRSVPCEVNKFDDMVRFLSASIPNFSQLVAVDAKFTLFKRAWCIAEVAAARDMGMCQDIKIGTAAELQEHRERMQGLRIQDMEASRPEDKAMILASIMDHDAFNASLQRLLFEELLPSWSSLDALERLATAGKVIRWQWNSVLI